MRQLLKPQIINRAEKIRNYDICAELYRFEIANENDTFLRSICRCLIIIRQEKRRNNNKFNEKNNGNNKVVAAN